ncbi:MAG: biotin/lipoyl-binding protein, partial [Candidatus Aminicenantes bacterium]
IHVVEGQRVARGDRLLSIDDTDLQAKQKQAEAGISAAEAVLANAEKMAERFENLYAEKSVSRAQLDDVLTGRDQAQAGLQMAKAGLAEVKVHPSSDLVGKTLAGAGVRQRFGIIVVALKHGDKNIFNPGPDERIDAGDVLVALGPINALDGIEKATQ